MILPERVFGNFSTNSMASGFAIGERVSATWPRMSAMRSLDGSYPVLSTTTMWIALPLTSCGRPIAAHSATAGWEPTAASTSAVPMR